MTKDNHFLGSFELSDIPPAPRGSPQIQVTFQLDVDGILKVTAEDIKNPNNKKSITIQNDKKRLSREDIDRMVDDAEKFAQEDKETKERIDLKAETEQLAHSTLASVKS